MDNLVRVVIVTLFISAMMIASRLLKKYYNGGGNRAFRSYSNVLMRKEVDDKVLMTVKSGSDAVTIGITADTFVVLESTEIVDFVNDTLQMQPTIEQIEDTEAVSPLDETGSGHGVSLFKESDEVQVDVAPEVVAADVAPEDGVAEEAGEEELGVYHEDIPAVPRSLMAFANCSIMSILTFWALVRRAVMAFVENVKMAAITVLGIVLYPFKKNETHKVAQAAKVTTVEEDWMGKLEERVERRLKLLDDKRRS